MEMKRNPDTYRDRKAFFGVFAVAFFLLAAIGGATAQNAVSAALTPPPATGTALLEPLGYPTANGTLDDGLVLPQKSTSAQKAWADGQPAPAKFTNRRLIDECNALAKWEKEADFPLTEAVSQRRYELDNEVSLRVSTLSNMVQALNSARKTNLTAGTRNMYIQRLANILQSNNYKRTVKSSLAPLKPYMPADLVAYFESNGGVEGAHAADKTRWQFSMPGSAMTAEGVKGVILDNGMIDCDGLVYRVYPSEKRAVLQSTNAEHLAGKDVTITSHIQKDGISYPVREIRPGTFSGNAIKSVTIPNTVKKIGNNAFAKMPCITRIVVPSSVTVVESACFHSCPELREVHLPNSVKRIGGGCFANCHKLTTVTLPVQVSHFDRGQFQECRSLVSVTLPANLTEIRDRMFSGCKSLVSIEIPATVTRIARSAFDRCSKLARVELPQGLTLIDDYAFSDCSALTSIVIPKSVTEIGSMAFDGCAALQKVTLGVHLKDYGTIVSAFDRRMLAPESADPLCKFTFVE